MFGSSLLEMERFWQEQGSRKTAQEVLQETSRSIINTSPVNTGSVLRTQHPLSQGLPDVRKKFCMQNIMQSASYIKIEEEKIEEKPSFPEVCWGAERYQAVPHKCLLWTTFILYFHVRALSLSINPLLAFCCLCCSREE